MMANLGSENDHTSTELMITFHLRARGVNEGSMASILRPRPYWVPIVIKMQVTSITTTQNTVIQSSIPRPPPLLDMRVPTLGATKATRQLATIQRNTRRLLASCDCKHRPASPISDGAIVFHAPQSHDVDDWCCKGSRNVRRMLDPPGAMKWAHCSMHCRGMRHSMGRRIRPMH